MKSQIWLLHNHLAPPRISSSPAPLYTVSRAEKLNLLVPDPNRAANLERPLHLPHAGIDVEGFPTGREQEEARGLVEYAETVFLHLAC
jgi:hypothetical protein